MRRLYEPTDKTTRIRLYKEQAAECLAKGFMMFAEFNMDKARELQGQLAAIARDAAEVSE